MTFEFFHRDFKARPFWWEAHEPQPAPGLRPAEDARVAIVGAGYAGLSAALELNREGLDCIVLDANEPGFGGSTRNGGMVSGGVNVGKRYLAKAMSPEEAAPFLNDAAEAFTLIEDLIARENIACDWTKAGYFLGAWCKSHYDAMAKKVATLNDHAKSEAFVVPRERQREEIGSDYYYGGMVMTRAAHIHPALYFKGLLDLCAARGIPIASQDAGYRPHPKGWRLAGRDAARHNRGRRRHHRHQRLYRRRHAATPAPRGAGRLLHYRHRGTAARHRQRASARRTARSPTPAGCSPITACRRTASG